MPKHKKELIDRDELIEKQTEFIELQKQFKYHDREALRFQSACILAAINLVLNYTVNRLVGFETSTSAYFESHKFIDSLLPKEQPAEITSFADVSYSSLIISFLCLNLFTYFLMRFITAILLETYNEDNKNILEDNPNKFSLSELRLNIDSLKIQGHRLHSSTSNFLAAIPVTIFFLNTLFLAGTTSDKTSFMKNTFRMMQFSPIALLNTIEYFLLKRKGKTEINRLKETLHAMVNNINSKGDTICSFEPYYNGSENIMFAIKIADFIVLANKTISGDSRLLNYLLLKLKAAKTIEIISHSDSKIFISNNSTLSTSQAKEISEDVTDFYRQWINNLDILKQLNTLNKDTYLRSWQGLATLADQAKLPDYIFTLDITGVPKEIIAELKDDLRKIFKYDNINTDDDIISLKNPAKCDDKKLLTASNKKLQEIQSELNKRNMPITTAPPAVINNVSTSRFEAVRQQSEALLPPKKLEKTKKFKSVFSWMFFSAKKPSRVLHFRNIHMTYDLDGKNNNGIYPLKSPSMVDTNKLIYLACDDDAFPNEIACKRAKAIIADATIGKDIQPSEFSYTDPSNQAQEASYKMIFGGDNGDFRLFIRRVDQTCDPFTNRLYHVYAAEGPQQKAHKSYQRLGKF